jgi:signal peptidase I
MSSKKEKIFKEILSYLLVIMGAAAFSISVRIFIFEPFTIPTPSMVPTLQIGDKVIVSKLAFKIKPIKRGDLIVFHSSIGKDLVKRVIAVEGDEITLTDSGDVYINSEKINEEYILKDYNISYMNETIVVEKDKVFVMGDNRNNSYDSRYLGSISKEDIFGEVVFIYLPLARFGRVSSKL